MDPGWDHTENEDKLLLAHALGMGRDMNDDIYGSEVRSLSSSGCSNDKIAGGNGLSAFTSEYKNHTLTLAINNVNYIPISNSSFVLFIKSILNFHIIESYSHILAVHINICYIFNICCCDIKCTCSCKCEQKCNGNTICLCICSCSTSSSGSSNGCCVCICKHKDGCKCICICVCKNGDKCCCNSGTHTCEKSIFKVDMGNLKDNSLQIVDHLCWIRCCTSRIENKSCSTTNSRCCCCICCVNGRCDGSCCEPCQSITEYYKSIMSRIHWIELLFNQISNEIHRLIPFKCILSIISTIPKNCKPCENCNCKGMMENLIKYTKNALRYYYLFGSRIKDIRTFVEYKLNYNKSKEIISSLEKSVKPLSMINIEINNHIVDSTTNNTSLVQINNLLMSGYSHYSFLSSLFFLIRVIQWAEFINDFLNTNDIPDRCSCVKSFELNKIDKFYIKGYSNYTHKIDTSILSKLYKQKHENHICLCLVVKYVLYPSIMILLYYVFGTNLEIHGTFNRKFDNYNHVIGFNNDVSKMLLFIFHIISVIIHIILKDSYVKWSSGHPGGVELKCFCMSDKYDKNYILTISLYLSSLMENIWSMDSEIVTMTIEKISSLLAEYQSIHVYTNYYSPMRFKTYSLLIDKDYKKTCNCGKKSNGCCCWCVTCFNLLVMLIYLCIQCNLCKAICNNSGSICDKVKQFCKIEECECKCKCPGKEKGLCCLLKLALCTEVASNKVNNCKSLGDLLKKCCTECTGKDSCCKKILDKVKAGLCKLLLLGCCCNDKGSCGDGDVKACCLLFGNECASVAVVVFCKCSQTPKGCCLYNLVEKLKSKLPEICQDKKCVCEELKDCCDKLCCGTECTDCVCKNIKDICTKLCNGSTKCLCEEIKKLKECVEKCVEGKCECKNKEGYCRCGWCKIVGMSIKILTRACRANVLEPYKRVVMELLSCSKDKKEHLKSILDSISDSMVNKLKLVKNSYISCPESIGSYADTINGVTNVETRNWGYDTNYEHDVSTYNSIIRSDQYPYFSHRNDSYSNPSVRSNKRFKMILSRLLVGGVIVFVFLYLRVSYQIEKPFRYYT